MISREYAKKQIGRLQPLRGFPMEPGAVGDLIDTLVRSATEPEAKEIVDAIALSATAESRCPLAGDIARMVNERKPAKIDPDCRVCQGTGFRIISRAGLTGAADCECRSRKV